MPTLALPAAVVSNEAAIARATRATAASLAVDRRADLDWLGVLAFGLLILYHAGMAWSGWSWHVVDTESIGWLREIMRFVNRWRMPLVFVVSGAAIGLALGHRTAGAFVRDRLAGTIGSRAARVRFVPRLAGDDFLSLMLASDVILDTLHFGGGNTTYEALAAGTPVVTMPSVYLRARFTQACYRELGIEDCIARTAEEYVRIAVRLAQRTGESRELRRRIRAESARLFRRRDAVDALAEWLSSVCGDPGVQPTARGRREAAA